MLLNARVLVVFASVLVVACHPTSPIEEKLLGTWDAQWNGVTESITFRSNHTFVTETDFGSQSDREGGVWRVDTGLLIRRFRMNLHGQLVGPEWRDHIEFITAVKFVLKGREITYERRK
jgi:hypothetical protein